MVLGKLYDSVGAYHLMSILSYVRQPIFHLRKTFSFRHLSHIPITIPVRWNETGFVVYADLFRNINFVARRNWIEEIEERRSFATLIGKFQPKVFWDVGANIGFYSLIFLHHTSNGIVLAFEPDQRNLDLLRNTVRRNAIDTLRIVPLAVDKQSGEATFFLDDITGASGSLVPENHFISEQYGQVPLQTNVRTTTLDEQLHRSPRPDIIKIDVEGADLAVLQGGRQMLETCLPIVLYEATQRKFPQTRDLLQSIGYQVFNAATLEAINAGEAAYNVIALHHDKHLRGCERLEL